MLVQSTDRELKKGEAGKPAAPFVYYLEASVVANRQ